MCISLNYPMLINNPWNVPTLIHPMCSVSESETRDIVSLTPLFAHITKLPTHATPKKKKKLYLLSSPKPLNNYLKAEPKMQFYLFIFFIVIQQAFSLASASSLLLPYSFWNRRNNLIRSITSH